MKKVYIYSKKKQLIEYVTQIHQAEAYKIIGASDPMTFKISEVDALNPDIVLIDSSNPYFVSAIVVREIKSLNQDYKVIVLTNGKNHESLYYSWYYGVNALCPKLIRGEELFRIYKDIYTGLRVMKVPNFNLSFNASKKNRLSVKPVLSIHEVRILKYLSKGYKRKEVEKIIDGEGGPIDYQCKKIFEKLKNNILTDVINQAKIEHIL